MIVSMLFTHGGALAKELALRVPLAPGPGAHTTTLLHTLLRWLELATSHTGTSTATADSAIASDAPTDGAGSDLRSPTDETREIGRAAADAGVSLMRLICGWTYGCPAAARELLQNPANLYVIDVAAGRCALLGEDTIGVTAAQRVAVKGLGCLMLGLLLEYVKGTAAPRSGSNAGDAEWTRGLVMKMIQNRVGESKGRHGSVGGVARPVARVRFSTARQKMFCRCLLLPTVCCLGMTPFMASIEAAKRAFSEAETAQRRRHRWERERKGSDKGKGKNKDKDKDKDDGRQGGASSGGASQLGVVVRCTSRQRALHDT